MRLLNSQKKVLFDSVQGSDFNVHQFEFEEDDENNRATLRLRGTDFYFDVQYSSIVEKWAAHYSPGEQFMTENCLFETWLRVPLIVGEWLQALHREISTPDPWTALKDTPLPDTQVSPQGSNTPFTVTEWETIQLGINEIRSLFLENAKSSQEARNLINGQLDKLISDGKRFGRKDWFNLAVGTIANIVVAVALSPEVTKQAWELLKHSISGIVELLPVIVDTASQTTSLNVF